MTRFFFSSRIATPWHAPGRKSLGLQSDFAGLALAGVGGGGDLAAAIEIQGPGCGCFRLGGIAESDQSATIRIDEQLRQAGVQPEQIQGRAGLRLRGKHLDVIPAQLGIAHGDDQPVGRVSQRDEAALLAKHAVEDFVGGRLAPGGVEVQQPVGDLRKRSTPRARRAQGRRQSARSHRDRVRDGRPVERNRERPGRQFAGNSIPGC